MLTQVRAGGGEDPHSERGAVLVAQDTEAVAAFHDALERRVEHRADPGPIGRGGQTRPPRRGR